MAGYSCPSCSFRDTLPEVVKHNRKVHVSDGHERTPCCICRRRIKSRKLRQHIRRCHPNDCPVQCSSCNGPFVEKVDMLNHMRCGCSGDKRHSERGVHEVQVLFNTSFSLTSPIPADMNTFLDRCSPVDVNKYIAQHLQTDESFRKDCGDVVDRVGTFFKGRPGFTVNRFIKGGSLGKGTAIKAKSDIDCVMFTSNLPSIDSYDYKRQLKVQLKRVEEQLEGSSIAYYLEVSGRTSHAVKLRTMTRKAGHALLDVDLLLATDLLGENPTFEKKERVYTMMGRLSSSDRENCSAALVELQRDFVKKQSAELKALILLVKMWKASCVTESSLTSYPLELLCIHTWRSDMSVASAFEAVLRKLSDYSSIHAYWMENYSYSRVLQMASQRPLILDPANPYNNVADRCRDWDAVARAARETLKKPFFSR